jgi:nicotinamidase-related amidase
MSNKTINEALVIVDMQDDFLERMGDDPSDGEPCDDVDWWVRGCYKKLLNGILREVKEAKRKRLPIICLQYANQEDGFDSPKESWEYHATDAAIRKALKGYSRAYFAWKDTDDGSDEVGDVLHGLEPRLGLDKPSFRGKPNKLRKFITNPHKIIDFTVVGVNANACVASTCRGLVDVSHKCRVPADAAMNVWDCSFANESSELDGTDGVRITNMKRAAGFTTYASRRLTFP